MLRTAILRGLSAAPATAARGHQAAQHGLCGLACSRTYTKTAAASGGGGSNSNDNDPASFDYHKELSFTGQTPAFVPSAEGWSEPLASVSEAVVKADRLVEDDAATDARKLEVLQQHTISVVQQLHHDDGPSLPKRHDHDVMAKSPVHKENLERTKGVTGESMK